MMVGCQTPQAKKTCEYAQMAHGGPAGAKMRMLMGIFMPKATRDVFEKCLSPLTMMGGLGNMMGGENGKI